jgi:hypothetical protein
MNKNKSLRQIFPFWFAKFVGVTVFCFLFFWLLFGMIFGRPNSTYILGFPFVFIYAFISFIIALMVGFIISFIFRTSWNKISFEGNIKKRFRIVTLISIVLCIGIGLTKIEFIEYVNRPQVIKNNETIFKILQFKKTSRIVSIGKLVYSNSSEDSAKVDSIFFNGKRLSFSASYGSINVNSDYFSSFASLDLRKYDYLLCINAVTLKFGKDSIESLAILMKLRATSDRSMLAIFNANGECYYQELLYRPSLCNTINSVFDKDSTLALYVNVDNPILYRKR